MNSAINGFIRLLTEEDRSEYVGSNDLLIKSLDKEVVERILNQTQVKVVKGRREKKTLASFGIAVSAMKYWHNHSNRVRAEGSAVIEISQETKWLMKELTRKTKNAMASDLTASDKITSIGDEQILTVEAQNSAQMTASAAVDDVSSAKDVKLKEIIKEALEYVKYF